jgi:hypothetical protein
MQKDLIFGLLGAVSVALSCHAGPGSGGNSASVNYTRQQRADGKGLRKEYKQDWREIECAMERLRDKIEQWGIVTASVPIVMTSQGQFKLDNAVTDFFTPKEYIAYQQGNVTGLSMQSTETALTNQFSGSAKGQFQINSVTGQVEPVLGPATDLDTSTLTAPSSLSLTGPLSQDRFAAPGSLLSGMSKISGNSGRAAVLLGMNDKLTERIMAVSANPPVDTFVNKDYQVYFAIVEVSCNPGWRTRENYIADLTADCEYYNSKSCTAMCDKEETPPRVFSVLPLLDAQNLELGNSARQLTAMAAQLAAAYPTIGLTLLGQDLITFVHRYQKDSVTRTPVTVTNSYSNGRTFGFRFAPSFTAQADPAYRRSKAANILNPTAFPVLVTVITKPALFAKGYDSVRVNVTTQWLIKDRPALPVFYKRLYTPLKRESITIQTDWARDVATLTSFIDTTEAGGRYLEVDPVLDTLRNRARILASKCGPQHTVIAVNPDRKPGPKGNTTIKSFIPSEVPKSDAFSMVLSGPNLGRATKVILGGKPSATLNILGTKKSTGEDSILVTFPQGNIGAKEDNYVDLEVITDTDIAFVEQGNLPILLKADRPKEAPQAGKNEVSFSVQRDPTGSITGVKLDLEKFPGMTNQEAIAFFEKIMEQDKRTVVVPGATPATGVNVNVK